MQDLLPLVQNTMQRNRAQAEVADIETGPLSGALSGQRAEATDITQFQKAVETVKRRLDGVNGRLKQLERTHEETKTIIASKQIAAKREEIQAAIQSISGEAAQVKREIDDLERANQPFLQRSRSGHFTTQQRIRLTVLSKLRQQLRDLVGGFAALRDRMRQDEFEATEKRVYTITGQHVAEEQINRIVDNGASDQLFQQAIREQGRVQVLNTLTDIQERHNAMAGILRSLEQLLTLFTDMAVLVEEQGQVIDNIEQHVGVAKTYVSGGVKDLEEAKTIQKSSRKMIAWVGGVIALIILIIIIAVSVSVTKNKNSSSSSG